MRNRNHMGVGFEVWRGDQSWFWLVIGPDRDCGVIGASPTEVEAVRDAERSIEERSNDNFDILRNRSLTELKRYLECIRSESARVGC